MSQYIVGAGCSSIGTDSSGGGGIGRRLGHGQQAVLPQRLGQHIILVAQIRHLQRMLLDLGALGVEQVRRIRARLSRARLL